MLSTNRKYLFCKNKNIPAFTLPEVLITLGIIGFVAMLILPPLADLNDRMILSSKYKQSYSELANAVELALMNEPVIWDDADIANPNPPFAQTIFSKYRNTRRITAAEREKYISQIKTYTDRPSTTPQCSQKIPSAESTVFTAAGSLISISQNCDLTWIVLDTNGIKKPNEYGHDIFTFTISKTGILSAAGFETEAIKDENGDEQMHTVSACSRNSDSTINGTACASYVTVNECPDDPSKKYWDCLP
jgi:type II secretory pathway pseudopilin PulG